MVVDTNSLASCCYEWRGDCDGVASYMSEEFRYNVIWDDCLTRGTAAIVVCCMRWSLQLCIVTFHAQVLSCFGVVFFYFNILLCVVYLYVVYLVEYFQWKTEIAPYKVCNVEYKPVLYSLITVHCNFYIFFFIDMCICMDIVGSFLAALFCVALCQGYLHKSLFCVFISRLTSQVIVLCGLMSRLPSQVIVLCGFMSRLPPQFIVLCGFVSRLPLKIVVLCGFVSGLPPQIIVWCGFVSGLPRLIVVLCGSMSKMSQQIVVLCGFVSGLPPQIVVLCCVSSALFLFAN